MATKHRLARLETMWPRPVDEAAIRAEAERATLAWEIREAAGELAARRHQQSLGWAATPCEYGTLTDPRWWSWPDHPHWTAKPGRPLGPVMGKDEADPTFRGLRDRELAGLADRARLLGRDAALTDWLAEAEALPPEQGEQSPLAERFARRLAQSIEIETRAALWEAAHAASS